MEPDDQAVIEEMFGCRVFNRYGCREASIIASECDRHQGLRTMAEGLYLEIIQAGKPAGAGEVGEILVTDLLNRRCP